MRKLFIILLISVFGFCIGCGTSPEHRRAHRTAIQKKFHEIHRSIDRHVWNYDWDDPHYN